LPAAVSPKGIDEEVVCLRAVDCKKLLEKGRKKHYKDKKSKQKISYWQALVGQHLSSNFWEVSDIFE
jgi:hypothetical protein